MVDLKLPGLLNRLAKLLARNLAPATVPVPHLASTNYSFYLQSIRDEYQLEYLGKLKLNFPCKLLDLQLCKFSIKLNED